MEIILRDHVDNLGRRGEVVKVADGYARNYLLPRKLALPATDANKKWIERERKIAEAREDEERGAAEAVADAPRRPRAHHHPEGRRERPAVRIGHQRPTSPTAQGEGLRGRSPQDPAARPDQGARRDTVPVKLHRDVTAQVKVTVGKDDVATHRRSPDRRRQAIFMTMVRRP